MMSDFQTLQYGLLYVFAPLLYWFMVALIAGSVFVSLYLVFLSAVKRMLSRFG